MTDRLILRHLTFAGPGVAAATIEFGPDQTFIIGPSNTGKSYIADALDFMFGARSLREIPETEGYTRVILCLDLPSEATISLVRSTSGGRFEVYEGEIRDVPASRGSFNLSARNNAKSTTNLSQYLLSEIGMRGRAVRLNSRNETRFVGLRDITRLCLVDEISMQETRSPILSTNYANNTAERSIFRLLLENSDDSDLEPTSASPEERRTSRSNVALLQSVIADLEDRLEGRLDRADVHEQLERLNGTIAELTRDVGAELTEQSRLINDRDELTAALGQLRDRSNEIDVLRTRFSLLAEQYESDLRRLATVQEAGQLLGYLSPGICPFCGADAEHQHLEVEATSDTTDFAAAIAAETARTEQLRSDLAATLRELDAQKAEVQEGVAEASRSRASVEGQLRTVDARIAPVRNDLQGLLATRSTLDKFAAIHDQIDQVRQRQADAEPEVDQETAGRTTNPLTVRSFSRSLERVAETIGIPGASEIFYDSTNDDVAVGVQPRASHGKGMRALLHATFNVALSEYCMEAELPHPGFVILDSPVVTYRGPDAQGPLSEDYVSEDVSSSFFANLHLATTAQSIIMENREPPDNIPDTAVVVHFTKSEEGRYGLFPPRAS